jgi:hypothetical protein
MERLQELITQLKEQFDRKADPSQMLQTARLLEDELQHLAVQPAATGRVSAKVAVMMPSSMKIYTGQSAVQEFRAATPDTRNGSQIKDATKDATPPDQEFIPGQKTAAELRTPSELKTATEGRTPADLKTAAELRTVPGRQSAAVKEPERGAWPFDPLADIPTLAHQQAPRELNDVIGVNGLSPSLNDKLKGNVLELSAALNDTPVRDLKKAIGVNDRFVFISQLFRGDEVMYERSIKTINGFRILPEAEYWMERELKVKLGWDENREATKHFYQLVRRRFS